MIQVIILIFTSVLLSAPHLMAQTSPQNVDAEEAVRKLFLYVTQPVTNTVITATIEIHQTPWSEQHIKEVVNQAHFEKRLDGHPERQKNVDALIKENMDSLRNEHSATNITTIREWLGPKLYRKDIITQPSQPVPVTNYVKGGHNVQSAWCNIYDTNFSEYRSWVANPMVASASATKTEFYYNFENLWESRVIEPESAFFFLVLVKKGIIKLTPETAWLRESFAPFRAWLDDSSLKDLVHGRNKNAWISVKLGDLDHIDCVILNLGIYEEKGAGFTYYMDWPNQQHLLKVVCKIPSKGIDVVTTRSDFDANGFPRVWTQSGQGDEGSVYRKISILEAEENPHWNLKDVFGVDFSTNYIVDEISREGIVTNLHWPAGITRPKTSITDAPSVHSFNKVKIVRTIIFTLILLPPLVMTFVAIKKRISK
jgi:hypothetical protein